MIFYRRRQNLTRKEPVLFGIFYSQLLNYIACFGAPNIPFPDRVRSFRETTQSQRRSAPSDVSHLPLLYVAQPPRVTGMSAPLIDRAAGEARNNMTSATA